MYTYFLLSERLLDWCFLEYFELSVDEELVDLEIKNLTITFWTFSTNLFYKTWIIWIYINTYSYFKNNVHNIKYYALLLVVVFYTTTSNNTNDTFVWVNVIVQE